MQMLQPNVSRAALGDAVEASLVAIQAHYARVPGGRVIEQPDIPLCLSGLAWRTLNGAGGAAFTHARAARGVEETAEFFRRAGVPWRWVIGPETRPEQLGQLLLEAGLTRASNHPGMALDLDRVNMEPSGPPGVRIEEVVDARGFEGFDEVQRRGMALAEGPARAWKTAHLQLGFGPDLPLRNFVATLHRKPVGAAAVYFDVGVAGVYNVVVVPEARGQGVGRAVTLAALQAGRDLGYRVSTLASSDLGLPVYLRLGYEEVCRIEVYVRE